MRWALAGLLCVCLSIGVASFDDELITRCCLTGRGWATDKWGSLCAVQRQQYAANITGADRDVCLNIAEICCIQKVESGLCDSGKEAAQLSNTCDAVQVLSADVKTWKKQKECCNCCLLGTAAATRLASCYAEEALGMPVCQQSPLCCQSFQSCCESKHARNQQHMTLASTRAPTTAAARTTAPPHRIGYEASTAPPTHRPDGMCFRYSAQLCEHFCHDDPVKNNGFSCSCRKGFQLRSNGRNCEQVPQESCEELNPCHASAQCHDTPTGSECRCSSSGYVLRDGRKCEDINECTDGTHTCTSAQNCMNEPGTYRCVSTASTCPAGYAYNQASGSCQIVSSAAGQPCQAGFRRNLFTRLCEDINECTEGIDDCSSGYACENTVGSFTCVRTVSCGTGYTMDRVTQRCIDEDECTMGTHSCGKAFVCTNTPGSFRCSYKQCPSGSRLNQATGNCELHSCPAGYELDASTTRCADIDECSTATVCRRGERCINTPGSYTCEAVRQPCQQGFESLSEGASCTDINECTRGSHNCRSNQRCVNRIGSFACECDVGYRMNRQTNDCEDFDECARSAQQFCSALTSTCVNIPGSYRCDCKRGFRSVDGRNCEDFNECTTLGLCQHECINTWGSYQCKCQPGYKLAVNNRSCEDIDECNAVVPRGALCYGFCENTPGSYRCSCPAGYQLSENGRECIDIDECATNIAQCSGLNQVCVNTRGGYKCNTVECPRHFAVATDGQTRNSVRCARQTFVCPRGDAECFTAPLSLSYNYLALHASRIKLPAELFTMRGHAAYRRIDFSLELKRAHILSAKSQAVTRDHFHLRVDSVQPNVAYVSLEQQIQGPQDITLDLVMNIYNDEGFFGSATATIYIYATLDPWLIESHSDYGSDY